MRRIVLVGVAATLAVASLSHQRLHDRSLVVGEMRWGTLLPTDPAIHGPFLGPQRQFVLEGRAGEHVVVQIESFEFDSFLILTGPKGRSVGESDDGAGYMSPRVAVDLPLTDRYVVTVGGTDPTQYGAYRVMVGAELSGSDVRDYLDRGLRWARRNRSLRAECFVNLAAAKRLREKGRWPQAAECVEHARVAADRGGFEYGRWLAALEDGTLAARTMDFRRAMRDLRLALDLARRLPPSSGAEARSLAQIGDVFLYLDKGIQAEACYRRALQVAERSGNPSSLARVYVSLVEAYSRDDEEAIEFARKAHDLRNWLDPALTIDVDSASVKSLWISGEPGAALAATASTLAEAHALGYRDAESSLLGVKSMIEFQLGCIPEMARSAREAAEAAIPDDPDPMFIRKALQTQADAAMCVGDHEGALDLCIRALEPMEQAWARQPVAEARIRLLSGIKAVCSQIIANLSELYTRRPSDEYALKAFDYAERSRPRDLLWELTRSQSESAAGDERSRLARESAIGRRILFFRQGGEPDPAVAEQIEADRSDAVVRRISGEEKCVPIATGLPIVMTAERMRKEFFKSHPNAAVLSYQLRPRDGVLIVLTADRASLFVLPGWKSIGDAVTVWTAQASADSPVSDYARASRVLYDMLIAPCASEIRGKDLVIVPDYMLNSLAFEGLVVDAPENPTSFQQLRYLVDDHSVTYAPSMSVLGALEDRSLHRVASGRNALLLIGDPVLDLGGDHAPAGIRGSLLRAGPRRV